MLNLAAVVLLLQIRAPLGVEASASVQGAVRSDATGVVVGGARVEMLDALASMLSDSAGAYFLQGLTPGAHRLRFSAHGFQPLAIDVLLLDGVPLSLDVSLSPIPARLVPVKILAPVRLRSPDTTAIAFEAGSWSVSGEKVRNSTMLADADAFRLLAGAPQAQMSPESPASVHVRGGSADQNLVLLDGAPVFSPVHPGYVLSAFSPDIIDAFVLHGGAPSARYGGQLSSVVDVRTPTSIPQTVATRGSFGPTAMRGSLDLPLVDGKAGLTLSARHSYSGLRRQDLAEGSMPGTWFDLFGKLSLRLGKSDITLSSFASDNALGFPASPASIDTVFRTARDNSFEWTSATQSAAWRRDIGERTQFEMIAWRARFDGGAVWTRDTLSLGMYSAVRNVGLSSTLAILHRRGRFTSGFQVERFSSTYIVNRIDSTVPSSDESLLQRSAAPLIRSLFAEERWSPVGDWTIVAGFRAAFVPGRAPRGEPRISLAFHPENRVHLSVGYARMHQFTQSLRGEESFLGTIVGPDFLAGVGAERIPVANSNEITASVTIPVAKESRLRFDWYGRNLSNLILPASANLDPFASRDYAIGSGEAWGLAASVESRIRRVSLNAAYSLGFARRVTDSVQFRPAFAASRSASLAIGYDASARTSFHSVMWVAAGRRTTLLSDDIGWDTRDPFSGAREVSGSPQRTQGPLDGTRLPLYLRFDVGARHAMSLWRTRAEVTGFAGVNNVFGRKNTTGYVQSAGTSTRRDLRMLPPSVVLGLEWRF
jgi:hypothetical protein